MAFLSFRHNLAVTFLLVLYKQGKNIILFRLFENAIPILSISRLNFQRNKTSIIETSDNRYVHIERLFIIYTFCRIRY